MKFKKAQGKTPPDPVRIPMPEKYKPLNNQMIKYGQFVNTGFNRLMDDMNLYEKTASMFFNQIFKENHDLRKELEALKKKPIKKEVK